MSVKRVLRSCVRLDTHDCTCGASHGTQRYHSECNGYRSQLTLLATMKLSYCRYCALLSNKPCSYNPVWLISVSVVTRVAGTFSKAFSKSVQITDNSCWEQKLHVTLAHMGSKVPGNKSSME